jgi:hypothetical protein
MSAARKAGPYVLVELLLPGGTLIALLLWFSSSGMGRGHFADTHPTRLSPNAIERPLVPKRVVPAGSVDKHGRRADQVRMGCGDAGRFDIACSSALR